MKDSQLYRRSATNGSKYIKESNERFSTHDSTKNRTFKYIKESNERFSTLGRFGLLGH